MIGRTSRLVSSIGCAFVVLAGVLAVAPPASAEPGGIVISEMNYHPGSDDDNEEFIELVNTGGAPLDISGWAFTEGIDTVIPASTVVPAGGYFVLSPDPIAFEALYGFVPDGIYGGKLSNGGEEITLVDGAAGVIDTVSYDDADPWVSAPDGNGPSLELRDLNSDNTQARNWGPSTVANGTPRAVNTLDGTAPPPEVTEAVVTPGAPAPGEAMVVSARLEVGSSATLTYKVMFGADVAVPMLDDVASPGGAGDGVYAATIPGQAATDLVRWRIDATKGAVGYSLPPAGDTINYQGLVVSDPSLNTQLPVINWYMADAVYDDLLANHRYDDVAGEAIIAWGDQVVDNATMRIRGNTSRTRAKVSWKVELPSGYTLDMAPLMPYPLDEFAIQRNPDPLTDLGWSTVAGAGARSLTTFPVRTQHNGDFWSVGHIMETEDGTWRDAQGVSDWAIYKGEGGGLRTDISPEALEARTEAGCPLCMPEPWLNKKEREDEDYTDVWQLTQVIDAPASAAQREWMFENLNIPELVNYMAVNAVIRHQDSGWYNWFVARDTEGTGRWEMWHWDLDWIFTTPASDGEGEFLEPDNNRMVRALMGYPDIRDMFYRRLRTLADEFLLPPGKYESMWDQVAGPYIPEWEDDRDLWGGYTPTGARNALLDGLADRYAVIADNTGPGQPVPASQSETPNVEIDGIEFRESPGTAEFVELVNPSPTESVDISGWTIDGVGLTIQPGTVLLPGAHVVFVADDVAYRQAYPGSARMVGGEYPDALAGDPIVLRLMDGARLVDEFTTGPPPPPDTEEPSAPHGLSSSAVTAASATVSWAASTDDRGVSGYEIARDGQVVGTVAGLSFTDPSLEASTTYGFTVRAFDDAGNRSAFSAPLKVSTGPSSPVLFSDGFGSADGSGWRSEWTASSAVGGTVDVQGGQGRLAVTNSSGSYSRAELGGVDPVLDSDLLLSFGWNSSAPRAYLNLWTRSSGGWLSPYAPNNGYGLQLRPDSSSVVLQRAVGGSLANLDVSPTATTGVGRQWVRLRTEGSTVQYRIWPVGSSEPSGWDVTVVDSAVSTAGGARLSVVRSSSSVEAKSVTIDDLAVLTDDVGDPPVNDDLDDAALVSSGSFDDSVSTLWATTEATEPIGSCADTGHSVWYRLDVDEAATVVLNTAGSGFDTVLAVFAGSPGSLSEVACDDDSGAGGTSELSFDAVAGTTYWIRAGGYGPAAAGQLELNVERTARIGAVAGDFDGDGDSDVAVYRPSSDGWFVQGGLTTTWGEPGDVAVEGDYNGDGAVDVAVFRPSDQTWHAQPSTGFPGGLSTQWGAPGDIPVPADYNGDGTTDIAVFRPSDQTWYAQPSATFPAGLSSQWGVAGDVPVPADFDGDGTDEIAVFRPSDQTWYSQDGLATQWGASGDIPIPVDFDGDGSDEVAVYRPSDQTWYSQDGLAAQWGTTDDIAVPGDYDGNGTTDVAVFRPSDQTWYVQGGFSTQWGTTDDIPVIVPYALRELY